jgi:hypothetical protein
MFEKIASKAFGLASVLAAFVVILAAGCDSGTSTSTENSSSSRGGGEPPPPVVYTTAIDDYDIAISLNDRYDLLAINAFVNANRASEPEVTFDSVVVRLDNKKLTSDNGNGKGMQSYTFSPVNYDIGTEYCDDDKHHVCLYAYVRGDRKEAFVQCEEFQRNKEVCAPPSSSSQSSSSIAVLRFNPIIFGSSDTLTLNSQTGTRGVILNSSQGVESPSDADIYYDKPGASNGFFKTGKTSVKIITQFQLTGYSGEIYWGPSSDNISNPQNTSDFVLTPIDPGSNEAQYSGEQYYMIRTSSSPPPYEWDTSDYLVLARGREESTSSTGNNRAVKIVAWKVN